VTSEVSDEQVDGLGDRHRGAGVVVVLPGGLDGAVAPVGVVEAFVEAAGSRVVQADADGEVLVAEAAGGVSPAWIRAVPMPRRWNGPRTSRCVSVATPGRCRRTAGSDLHGSKLAGPHDHVTAIFWPLGWCSAPHLRGTRHGLEA
jgi:hypothetical protein